MKPTITGPIPRTWSGSDFNVINTKTGTVLDLDDPSNVTCGVHAWPHEMDNLNQIWKFNLIDTNANIWTIQATRTERYLEVKNGVMGDKADIITRAAFADTDPQRLNQQWFMYLVEGAGAWPAIAVQNVGTGKFMNLWEGKADKGASIYTYSWDESQAGSWRLYKQIDRKK